MDKWQDELYINYESFELTVYDMGDGKGNMAMGLSIAEAKAVCKAIGLMGFRQRDGKTQTVYNAETWGDLNTRHLKILENTGGKEE